MRTPIIAVTLLSAACNVTDTGNPVDTGGEPSGNAGSCEEVETVITPDELTPLGFSAADVLGVAGGRHTETLAWLQGGLATSSGGEPTQVEVHVDFDGSARFIESSPRQSLGGSGSAADFAICNDRVELDATLTVSTADGALDETVSAVLRAETARLATASFSIPSDELSGDLKVNVNAPDGFEPEGLPTLQFDIDMADVGFAGSLAASASFSSDGAVAAGGGGVIARWPSDGSCEQGFSVAVEDSDTFLKAMQAFNDRGLLSIGYEPAADAAELEYELTSSATLVCEEIEANLNGTSSVSFAGSLMLASSDQLIDGRFDVAVTVLTEANGDISEVRTTLFVQGEDPSALLEMLGIQQSVDFSEYDQAAVRLNAQWLEGGLDGTLSVQGVSVPACLTEPPPEPQAEPGGGMSIPGCEGIDYTDLWVAHFEE